MGAGQELSSWNPGPGAAWDDLGDGTVRPSRIEAMFVVGDLVVTTRAIGDPDGIRITRPTFKHKPDALALTRAMVETKENFPGLVEWLEDECSAAVTAEEIAAFDPVAAAAMLERVAIVAYEYDRDGRPERIRFGAHPPAVTAQDVRRLLHPDDGRAKTGPKPKAKLADVAKLWRAATRKGAPPTKSIAENLGVSSSTAHRYIAAARDAGLIKEDR